MHLEADRFTSLTEGLPTKSEKIRTLARHGASTRDIARFLQIHYTHARNVLKDAGLHRIREAAETEQNPAAPSPSFEWVEIDTQGRIQLTAFMREKLGLSKGDRVMLRLKGNRLEVLSQEAAWQEIQTLVRDKVPQGVSLANELIAERHRESQRELQEVGKI
jgi:bifunctional DNA-binding transcriptional regulator/antitoxin component of YhaV-PrlF toxin-antitoxin module